MVSFNIRFDGGSIQSDHYSTDSVPAEFRDLPSTGIEPYHGVDRWNFFHSHVGEGGQTDTVSKMAAWCQKFNAEVDYIWHGVKSRHEIVSAYLMCKGQDSPLTTPSLVSDAKLKFIGRFEDDMDFIKHFFDMSDTVWLFERIDWSVAAHEFMRDYHAYGGYYFEKVK